MNQQYTQINLPPSVQPKPDSGIDTNGLSDVESNINPNALEGLRNTPNNIPISTLAYGPKIDIASIAYGGNTNAQTLSLQSGRVSRLQRGVPRMRRGTLVPAVPRTKSQTVYTRDPGQTIQNKVLSTGSTGVSFSGTPSAGTSNKPNVSTGAVNRYRTSYTTLIQPSK